MDGFFDYGPTDADLEMAELESLGRQASRLRRKGVCAHGHYQTRVAGNPAQATGKIADLEHGQVLCLECGKVFADAGAHENEWRALIGR